MRELPARRLRIEGLFAGQCDQGSLFIEKVGRHGHLDPDVRREDVAQGGETVLVEELALVAGAAVVCKHPIERSGDSGRPFLSMTISVGASGASTSLWTEMSGNESAWTRWTLRFPRVELSEFAGESVGVVDGLREGVAEAFRRAVLESEPFAVSALEAAPLHLEADDRCADLSKDEVDLAVVGTLGVVAGHPADGMERFPGVVEAVAQCLEDTLLALALDLGLDQGPGVHLCHGCESDTKGDVRGAAPLK